jgi:hypothetical protein
VPRALTRGADLLLAGALAAGACSEGNRSVDRPTTAPAPSSPVEDRVAPPGQIALTFTTEEPVWPADFPDPFLLEVDGEHLAFAGPDLPTTAQLRGTFDQAMSLSERGSPGRPSTRSPRMFLAISVVPPSIELARARRNACWGLAQSMACLGRSMV